VSQRLNFLFVNDVLQKKIMLGMEAEHLLLIAPFRHPLKLLRRLSGFERGGQSTKSGQKSAGIAVTFEQESLRLKRWNNQFTKDNCINLSKFIFTTNFHFSRLEAELVVLEVAPLT
jgi:hypothetical protein